MKKALKVWSTTCTGFGAFVGIMAGFLGGYGLYISPVIIIPWALASLFGGF